VAEDKARSQDTEQTSKREAEKPKSENRTEPSQDTSQAMREQGAGIDQAEAAKAAKNVETGDVLVLDTEKDTFRASRVQSPSLVGRPEVEVAERTQDTDKAESGEFVKDFIVRRDQFDAEDPDAVHARNATAVRQFMVNQGLRPDADVRFVGEEDHWDGVSVVLHYSVGAVPAAVATSFGLAHTVIPSNGPTPEQLAAHEAKKEERVLASHDALRQ
jgi:hypothetical protein